MSTTVLTVIQGWFKISFAVRLYAGSTLSIPRRKFLAVNLTIQNSTTEEFKDIPVLRYFQMNFNLTVYHMTACSTIILPDS